MFMRYLILVLTASALILTPSAHLQAADATTEHAHADVYYCPMHPQVISDKPGSCPICGMRLVLNASSGAGMKSTEGRSPVPISADERKQMDIKTYEVGKKHLQKTVSAFGRVAHDPELYQLQIDFLREEYLGYLRERDRTILAKQRSLTGQEKIAVKFLDMGLSEDWVKALAEEGVPDRKLLYHHDAGGFWVYLQIRESDATLLKVGDVAKIQVTSLPNSSYTGKVAFLDSKIDMETGTLRARVLIESAPLEVKPNMAVSGSVDIDLGDVLAIPEDAVLFSGERTLVWVDEAGVFKPRQVSLGRKSEHFYEVKEGLMPGEKIAASGNFFIDSESRLRASLEEVTHGSHS